MANTNAVDGPGPEGPSPPQRPRLMRLARRLSVISTAALWAAGIGLVVMTVIVAWQVFGRYVLNQSNSWTEPAAIMLMSWFIFLGAAVGIRENSHLGFDVLLYFLPKGSKRVLRTISDVVVLVFAIGMVVYGMQLVQLTWAARLPALGLPGGFNYLPVVAGGVLIALFALERILMRFAGIDVDRNVHVEEAAEVDVAGKV
jgi:TRAP-type C4-dicarboxylate transport system permease small subunit